MIFGVPSAIFAPLEAYFDFPLCGINVTGRGTSNIGKRLQPNTLVFWKGVRSKQKKDSGIEELNGWGASVESNGEPIRFYRITHERRKDRNLINNAIEPSGPVIEQGPGRGLPE